MFRDAFIKISIPVIFGETIIDPFDFVDLTPFQKKFLASCSTGQIAPIYDQFFDVFDIHYGLGDLRSEYRDVELVRRLLSHSKFHIHAAVAILTAGYDFHGAVQSAILATELSMKAAVASNGLNEIDIKDQFGHNFEAIAKYIGSKSSEFDLERVLSVISRQPKYVHNRYSAQQPKRLEVGHIAMGAQYIVSEVVRLLSETNARNGLKPTLVRAYPM